MTELLAVEEDEQHEEIEVGSLNHSIVQTQIASLLLNDNRFKPTV